LTKDQIQQLKEYDLVYVCDEPYVFISFCGNNFIVLDQTKDYDSFLLVMEKYFKFVDTIKYSKEVLDAIDEMDEAELINFKLFKRDKRRNFAENT